MKLKNLRNQFLLKALEKTKFGSLKLRIQENASEQIFGEGPLVAEVVIKNTALLHDFALRGDLALAEAVVDGTIVISDEAAFIQWACRNEEALKQSFHGNIFGTILPRIRQALRKNTISGAKKNIMAHYDLGNDFYQTWLDSSMSYSSALFRDASYNEDLREAQNQKYDRIIDALEIKESDHVLEVGCGWGGFFSRVVERTGCKVTAVMNSPAQASFNQGLLSHQGLQANVSLELKDYRHIEGVFDKIVSIEMIEAVGMKYWPNYFAKLSSSLKLGGQAMIQSITIREDRFASYSRTPDFINNMIFPGGMLLTNNAISENAKKVGLNSEKPFEFGLCYAETLRRWRVSFHDAVTKDLLPNLDERFINLWRFYLSYCEGAFAAGRINVAHFQMEKYQ